MEQIKELLKKYKCKLLLDDEKYQSDDTIIFFTYKDYTFYVQSEDENDLDNLSFGITTIENTQNTDDEFGFDLDNFYQRFNDYGDINDFECFLDAIINGQYLYVKNMYKDIVKLFQKYEDNQGHLNNLIQYFLFV